MKVTVLEDVAFAPLNFGYADHEEKAMWALELLGIDTSERPKRYGN